MIDISHRFLFKNHRHSSVGLGNEYERKGGWNKQMIAVQGLRNRYSLSLGNETAQYRQIADWDAVKQVWNDVVREVGFEPTKAYATGS